MPHTPTTLLTLEQLHEEQLRIARYVVGNPARFAHEPDFSALIQRSWYKLKSDQLDRIEAKRAAEAIRSTFPEDAA